MGSRLFLRLLWAAGWLGVFALGSSAAMVTFGSVVVSGARASEPEALEDVDPEDEQDLEDLEAPSLPRVRAKPRTKFEWNPFCPTCTDVEPSKAVYVASEGDGPEFAGARPTQLPITLNATLESTLAAASFAVIHDNERGVRGPYFIGDELRPGVRVDSIGPGSILLSNNGVSEYALVDPETAPLQAEDAKPAEEKRPEETASGVAGANEAIACSGTTCTVKREFIDGLLRDPSVLMGQGNVMPTTTADGRSGFRITGARKGTLPRMLGLKSGDVLVEVGGKAATIDELLSLRARFGGLDRLELTVLRKDQPVDLTLVFDG